MVDELDQRFAAALFNKIMDGIADILLLTDYEDIGKFDRLHHWHLGFVLKLIINFLDFLNVSGKLVENMRKFFENSMKSVEKFLFGVRRP